MKLLAQLFSPLRQAERDTFEEGAVDFHTTAPFLESIQMSHGDLASLLRTSLRAIYRAERTYVWIRDVFDDRVVYELSTDDITTLYQRTYAIAEGTVTFGEPIAVVAVTQYVAVEQTGITVPVTQMSQPAEESATPLTGAIVPLVEKAVGPDSTIKIKVIQAGQGSSGYYGADMLKRDGPKVFTPGLHMYIDHPSLSEETDRPERSVKDLAGTLTTAARWEEEGAAGPGLYADAQIRSDFAPLIEELAPHIGVSIRAWGKARNGEVDGKPTRIIDTIEHAGSVDFVTIPGAGGSILQLVESARNRRAQQPTEDDDVSKEELEEANRKIAELQAWKDAQEARAAEATLLGEARTLVAETLASITLPVPTRARLTEALAANPPLKDGALDRETLTTKVKEAAAREVEYLTQATGGNPIRNLGDTTPTTPSTVATLEESEKRIAAALAAV
jgi:hypothetical protein